MSTRQDIRYIAGLDPAPEMIEENPYPLGKDYKCYRCDVTGRSPKDGPHVCWFCEKGDALSADSWKLASEREAKENKRKVVASTGAHSV